MKLRGLCPHGVVPGGTSGDGGNRTRVQRCKIRASPCAVRCDFLSPGDHANKSPTGPVTVWFPIEPRDRARWFSPLDYARVRVGNIPGLTPVRAFTHCLLGSEGEGAGIALGIGDYWLRHMVNEIIAASSTRFPCFNSRCRNRSSPCCFFNAPKRSAHPR